MNITEVNKEDLNVYSVNQRLYVHDDSMREENRFEYQKKTIDPHYEPKGSITPFSIRPNNIGRTRERANIDLSLANISNNKSKNKKRSTKPHRQKEHSGDIIKPKAGKNLKDYLPYLQKLPSPPTVKRAQKQAFGHKNSSKLSADGVVFKF